MYIQPNTTIHILKNVPLARDYENTVYYSDKDKQETAFLKYKKYTLSNYSYQRATIGSIRVQLKYENLYDCNYLMFKNTAFENKWFYAFIDGVSYINDEVSEIYYSLDVLQTWCYDYKFLDSFVERRHASDDTIYSNTQPEGLELGSEYEQVSNIFTPLDDETYYVVIASQKPANFTNTYWLNTTVNDIFTGCYVFIHNLETTKSLIQMFVDEGLEDTIVAFYQAPTGTAQQTKSIEYTMEKAMAGGYTPKNKKLYCFPFTKLTLTNRSGLTVDYEPQYFEDGKAEFTCKLISFPQAMARMYPTNYSGGSEAYDNSLIYGAFPTCSFSGDAFAVWWAQNKNNYIATVNSIINSYDTNMQIAQNNYSMANRNANASSAIGNNTIAQSLAASEATANQQARNAGRSLNVGAYASYMQNIKPGSTAMENALNGVGYINTIDSLATSQANAENAANVSGLNLGISVQNARQNAATNFANANLSNLTSKNNAIQLLEAKKQDIKNTPNTAHGNAMCDGMNWAEHVAGFNLIQLSIKPEYAKIIDNYFTAYGYAQNCLMSGTELNNRINRPHFTYTRTVGANITGELNQQDLTAIRAIYDNGVTTWDTLEDIGNYELDNTI